MARRRRYRAPHSRRSGRLARYEDQVIRWILRALLRAGAVRAYITQSRELDPSADTLLRSLGVALPSGKRDAATALGRLQERLAELERTPPSGSLAGENARLLGALLELNPTETEVLAFAIALEAEEALRDCFGALRERTHAGLCGHIAQVLGRRTCDVERALAPSAKLRSVPVVEYGRVDVSFDTPIGLASSVDHALMRPLAGEQDLLRHFMTRVPAACLTLEDYPHLAGDLTLLGRYLRAVLARRKRGVNLLLHGPPGTGKTQLARAIAEALHAELYQVNLEDADRDAYTGAQRLQAYALCQRFLRRRRRTLLLFDEVEDVFPRRSELDFGYRPNPKAWTNRLLEQNPVPTLWISNAIGQIDRAYIRRFDFVLEVCQPPRKVRRRVLDKHLLPLRIRPQYLERLAELDDLSPAHVERAAELVRLTRPHDGAQAELDLERVVRNNLRAFSGSAPQRGRSRCELPYDLGLINAEIDLGALIAGLRRRTSGTLCFYGPPGTGKTELARHLGRELGLPVREHRASDLLDKYLGVTEQRIAAMFAHAERDGALLLLDEADSFLIDRRSAHHSWEVTQVNEMLTQMEQFEGLFVCSSNLVDHIDRAALRRFALKAKLDYLKPPQAERLFRATLAAFGDAQTVPEGALAELARLRLLTPGDFAAVTRRARMLDQQLGALGLLRALERECELKRERGGRALGFGA